MFRLKRLQPIFVLDHREVNLAAAAARSRIVHVRTADQDLAVSKKRQINQILLVQHLIE